MSMLYEERKFRGSMQVAVVHSCSGSGCLILLASRGEQGREPDCRFRFSTCAFHEFTATKEEEEEEEEKTRAKAIGTGSSLSLSKTKEHIAKELC